MGDFLSIQHCIEQCWTVMVNNFKQINEKYKVWTLGKLAFVFDDTMATAAPCSTV